MVDITAFQWLQVVNLHSAAFKASLSEFALSAIFYGKIIVNVLSILEMYMHLILFIEILFCQNQGA